MRDYGATGQLGLESTPEQYVENLVAVFREIGRVLRADGTVWLNLGDSYAGSGPSGASYQSETTKRRAEGDGIDGNFRVSTKLAERGLTYAEKKPVSPPGLKPKDLVGIPWRTAFALQADGWWLRSDIIWSKPNPMPESVTDRPTRAHEYLFLLTKSARYFYDAEAIKEGATFAGPNGAQHSPYGQGFTRRSKQAEYADQPGSAARRVAGFNERWDATEADRPLSRNKRSVWEITTQPYPEAHFATFPPKLVEPCILAGSSPKACGECGAPWERIVETNAPGHRVQGTRPKRVAMREGWIAQSAIPEDRERQTVGWGPSCGCYEGCCEGTGQEVFGDTTRPCQQCTTGRSIVLDPFAGSGTTGVVALRHDRDFIGIELNAAYCELARNRIRDDAPLLNHGIEVVA